MSMCNTFKPRPLFPCLTSARSTVSPCTWRGRPAQIQWTWRLGFWARPTWRRRGAWNTFQRLRTWQWVPGWRMRSSPGSSLPACPPSSWFYSSWRTAATRTNSSSAFSMFLLQKLRCVHFFRVIKYLKPKQVFPKFDIFIINHLWLKIFPTR